MLDPAPKDVYRNHVLARKLFGLTMLIWATYIGVTYLCHGAFENPILSISINLSRFYIFGSLLEITFSALVDNQYPIVRKARNRLILWCVYMALMALNVLFVPEAYQWYLVIASAAYYAYEVYAILRRYFSVYRNMRKKMDDYYSENVDSFTRWMLTSSYGLGIIGYSAIGLAFAHTIGLLLFMVAGVLFFNYMSYSLYRYTISVGHIKEVVMTPDSEICDENHLAKQQPPIYEDQNPIYISL